MKVVAIIAARMTSSRLPGKSLMKICGDPVLQHMLTRVKRAKLIDKIIVATQLIKQTTVSVIYAKKWELAVLEDQSRMF